MNDRLQVPPPPAVDSGEITGHGENAHGQRPRDVGTRQPYPGLRPFNSLESNIFFGRDVQKVEMLQRLKASRFLAIVGASGCGKSSLVHAGLVPSLHAGLIGVPEGSSWQVAVMRPGSRPIERLAKSLIDDARLAGHHVRREIALGMVMARLSAGPLGLIETLQAMPPRKDHNLLVVADQFEEIFRYRTDLDEKKSREADLFVATLLASAEQRTLPIFVVLTMRSDFIGNCAVFDGLPEAVSRSQYLTPRLTREQRELAIVGPARVCGGSVDPRLVARLLNETGDDPNQLPVLQHALMRMWTLKPQDRTCLTLEDYLQPRVNGLANALSLHADEAFDQLDERQKQIAEVMFRRLCEATNSTRRPTKTKEIATLANASVDEVIAVADAFRSPNTNFVTPPFGETIDEETKLDISHESLIREWKKLHSWVDTEALAADNYRLYRQLACKWPDSSSLLTSTNLQQAIKWRDANHPTALWAKRYDDSTPITDPAAETPFERTMRFISESEQAAKEAKAAREAELRQQEEERRNREIETKRQLRQARRMNAMLIGLLVAVLVLGGWSFTTGRLATRSEARAVAAQVDRFLDDGDTRLGLFAAANALPSAAASWTSALIAAVEEPLRPEFWQRDFWKQDFWKGDPQEEAISALERALARPVADIIRDPSASALAGLNPDPVNNVLLTITEAAHADPKTPGAGKRKIQQVSFASGSPPRLLTSPSEGGATFVTLDYSADGKYIATVNAEEGVKSNYKVTIWDSTNWKPLREFRANPGDTFSTPALQATWNVSIARVAGNPGVYRILSGSFDVDPRTWTWDSRKNEVSSPVMLSKERRTRQGQTITMDLSPDGRYAATGSLDGDVRVWDATTGKLLFTSDEVQKHSRFIKSVRFSPTDATLVASASADKSIHVFHLDYTDPQHVRAKGFQKLAGHNKDVSNLAFNRKGDRLASASLDGTVRLWDVQHGTTIDVLQGPAKVTGRRAFVAFSNDGQRVAANFSDERTFIWDLKSNPAMVRHLPRLTNTQLISIDPQDRRVLTASADKAQIWNAGNVTPTSAAVRAIPLKSITAAAFSPSGHAILTASAAGAQEWSALVWPGDGRAAEPLRTFGEPGAVAWAGYDPFGRVVAVAADTSLRLFDTATGAEVAVFQQRAPLVKGAFSADGGWIATLTADRSLYLWRTGSGAQSTTALPKELGEARSSWELMVQPRRATEPWGAETATVTIVDLPFKTSARRHSDEAAEPEQSHIWTWDGTDGSALTNGAEQAWPIGARYELHVLDSGEIKILPKGARLEDPTIFALTGLPALDDGLTGIATGAGRGLLAAASADGAVRLRLLPCLSLARESVLPSLPPLTDQEKKLWRIANANEAAVVSNEVLRVPGGE